MEPVIVFPVVEICLEPIDHEKAAFRFDRDVSEIEEAVNVGSQ